MSTVPSPACVLLAACAAMAMVGTARGAGEEACVEVDVLARARCLGASGDPAAIETLLGLSPALPALAPHLAARLARDTDPTRLAAAVEALEDPPSRHAAGLRALRELALLDEASGEGAVPVASHLRAARLCGAALESEHPAVAIQGARCASVYWEEGGREAIIAAVRPGRDPGVLQAALEQIDAHREATPDALAEHLLALLAETQVRGEWTTSDGMVRRLACLTLVRQDGVLGDEEEGIIQGSVDEWSPRQTQFADGCRLLLALRGLDGYPRSGDAVAWTSAPPEARALPYVVAQGDSLASINCALGLDPFESGLDPYLSPANANFRVANPDPDRLQAGSSFVVPDRVDRAGFKVLHEVHSNESRSVHFYLHGVELDASLYTDRDGVVTVLLPAILDQAQLRSGAQLHRLEFGLAPPHTLLGVQQRLGRLGHEAEPTGILDPQTRAALRSFQEGSGLEPTGELDDATLQALLQAAGL